MLVFVSMLVIAFMGIALLHGRRGLHARRRVSPQI
jgi:hypothetical protein